MVEPVIPAAPAVNADGAISSKLPSDGKSLNPREAATALGTLRDNANKPPKAVEPVAPKPRAEDGKFVPHEPDPPKLEGDDAAAEKPPGETTDQNQDDTAVQPPAIDPPRSWTTEDKAAFQALPPDIQQRIAERERARDAEIRKGQDQAATERKAIEAERQQALALRQQYEQAIQNTLQTLQHAQASEFPDIKTVEDVQKLASEDPFRFARWQAHQEAIRQKGAEYQHAQQRAQQESQQQFETWSQEQDKIFAEKAKDFADPVKAPKARENVVKYLTEAIGVDAKVLPDLWKNPFFRDAKMQLIIADAARWHQAQASAQAAAKVATPPVLRPGTAPAAGDQKTAQIESAQKRLQGAKGIEAVRAAADLMAARRANVRRAT